MIESIIYCLNINYGISAVALTLLPIGADMNASVYKADTQNSQSYFIKLKRGHRDDVSVAILALLQASGVQHIIPPLKTTDGELTHRSNDFTLTVYPFVDGQNGFHHRLTDDQWVTLGKALRQVHELDVPPSIKDQIRKETYSDKWRNAVRSLYAHVDGNLKGDEATLNLQSFMKEYSGVIHHLVNRADALSQKIQEQSPEFVLCHSDIHGGNVLIDESDSIFIVDWDDPIMAPKERDLMFIGGGVANVWNNPREEDFFYKGYGETEINRVILAYYRHERIVEDIAEFGQALLLTTDGGKERLKMFEQFKDMFEPNGVVDIALKTDFEQQARLISSEKEKKAALDFRQKHFFDRLNIQDPYAWALDQKNHLHWILYDGVEVIGYAHVQMWPDHRAALRIIVIDEQRRGQGMGKCLMDHCEQVLKHRGVTLLQTEASPNACLF
ncbi:MAG: GNAT family N-acetyltransferase [Chlamydiales bacterium]|nr:GNAT family N-acetyltransferase [Chlamydiia bacterium]MCP5506788.1 GNAT family N-acetyltransferase [Chlamydiales bacterium]